MSNTIIVSDEYKNIVDSIRNKGFDIIDSEEITHLIPYERRHADIQCLKINDTFFVVKSCKRLIAELKALDKKVITTEKDIKKNYPCNVLLNALFIDGKLYCKTDALDETVKRYCVDNNIEIINVNQGYTKCSTAVFGNSFITADIGIFEKLTKNGVEGLLIESGDITLDGADYGFIGGCSFYNNGTAYFTGDLTEYKNGNIIKDYLNNKGIKIEYLIKDKLIDIGGFIVL